MSSYDENLLRSAPTATKAQIQDGYDPALLEGKHTPSGSTTHLPPDLEPGRGTPNRSPIQQAPGQIPFSPEKPLPVQRKQPFYRTSKGIIIIIVVALVVIGAVVGGAVGGTQKKNKNLEVAPGSTQVSSGDQSQGTGPQNSNDTSSVSHISQQTFGPSSTIAGQDTQSTSTNADDAASDPLATPTRIHAIPSNTLSDLSPGQITPPVQPPGTQGDGNGAAGSSPFGTGGGNLAGAFGSFP